MNTPFGASAVRAFDLSESFCSIPGDSRYALGFNPLSCGLSDPGETASMVLEAFLKAWGASSFDQTPRLEGLLRGVFRLLIDNRLTLLEGYDLLKVENSALRKALLERVSDPYVRQDWQEFEKLAKNDKLAVVESSRNRLRRVVQATALQMMLAQTKDTLDFGEVMDEGKFLLANLGGIPAPETQRLIGALLVNGIFHAAKHRNSRHRRDWFLIVDECGQYATRDLSESLDQLRKMGCHLVMAHQRLQQLQREDADVLSAVMTNAKIKIVFGGLERPEAERMARELFTGQVRGDRVKHIATQTKFRPVLDTFLVESESSTTSESESDGWGRSGSSSSDLSETEGEGAWDERDAVLRSSSRGRSRSESQSTSRSGGRGSSTSRGSSRSTVPITRHEEFHEETGRQFWTLEEEWEHLVGVVHGLPKRQAVIKVYNRPVIHIVTPEVERERPDRRLERFQTSVLAKCPQAKPVNVVIEEIEERRQSLALLTEKAETSGRPMDPKSFRE